MNELRGTDPTPLTTSKQIDVTVPPKPNLHQTHPNLFLALFIYGVISVAVGVNFLLTTPTFQQYGIPKGFIGATFASIGLGLLFCLLVWRSLKAVRVLSLANIAVMIFWGIGTTQTFFEGTSSLQLCVLYFGLAALQVPWLLEPYYQPVTANGHGPNGKGPE